MFFISFKALPAELSVPLILTIMILALSIGNATKWVRVTYRTDEGDVEAAWFADGSNFGWAGIFGGTLMLCDVIRASINAVHDLAGTDANGELTVLGPLRTGRGPVKE